MKNDNKKLTIVVPLFNEADTIELNLGNIISFAKNNNFNLIVINDGSTDSTQRILDRHKNDEIIKIITHKINKGYGAAIKSGIKEVNTECLVTFDGDGQHILDDILNLYRVYKQNNADMVVGSRKNSKPNSLYRHFGKFLIRSVAKLLLPLKIYDINSGMKIYNAELAKKYIKQCPDSMAFSDIITLFFIHKKHLVIEEPIEILNRLKGTSTISTKTAFETILELFNIIMLFNPIRIFLPLALLFFLSGLIWGLPIVLDGKGISIGALLAVIAALLLFLLGLLAEQLSLIRKKDFED